jgi:hypothetical protein
MTECECGARTSATGTAWERTPWRATQRAAWEALKRMKVDSMGVPHGERLSEV